MGETKRRAWALAVALALLPATAAATRTVVTLSFDDERVSQLNALPILDRFGMKGSFFINSGRVGESGRLTWAQIRAIAAAGHEIGGHTIDHEDLTSLSTSEATRQVCDDRDALIANGIPDPISFAYPFGAADADAEAIVGGCGYLFARAHGGIRSSGCSSCPPAEPIPPPNPLHLRSSRSVQSSDDLAYLQERVLLAETTGGWINVNFHDVCNCSGTYVITPTLLEEFLAWLAPRAATHDTVVRPMGLAFGAETNAPTAALTSPPNGATVLGTVALAAAASDDSGVALVEFLANGTVVASDTSSPYQGAWDSTTVPNGTAILASRTTDLFGNTTLSAPVTVTVSNPPPDTTPPTVALTAPQDGATVSGTVTIAATASDSGSGVARVDFLVNGVVFGSDATAPFQISWNTAAFPNGVTQLTARAVDGKGNAALSAPRAVTVANLSPVTFLLPFGSVWKYWDAGTDPGATWFTAGFDDAAWRSGPGELGYGDGDEATVLTRTTPRQPSVYFRRTLALPGTPTTSIAVRIKYDDGYALWVNGTLASTSGVGSLAHAAFATSSNENTFRSVTLPASLLHAGDNQLAVMIKQRSSTSSDVSFDFQLGVTVQPEVPTPDPDTDPPTVGLNAPPDGATVSGTVTIAATASDSGSGVARVDFLVNGAIFGSDATSPYQISWDTTGFPNGVAQLTARAVDGRGNVALSAARSVTVANTSPVTFLLPFGSVWKYWDAGTDPGSTWFTAGFDDAAWRSGPGELGYGDGDEATVLTVTTPRQPSVYFRRTLALPGTPTTTIAVRIKYDDGYALWVNGTLASTSGVGSLAHAAFATSSNENTFRSVTLPASLLHAGDNQLAVMIKQRSSTSSDVSFDFQLGVTVQPEAPPTPTGGGLIAFASDRTGTAGIYLANADGSNATLVATGDAPAWSADGTKIAFHRSGQIWVMDANGSNQTALRNGTGPTWSPDGTKIAYDAPGGIYVMNADGSSPQLLVSDEFANDGASVQYGVDWPDWSPDGTWIAFVRANYNQGHSVHRIRADFSSPDITLVSTGGFAASRPAWSPDGARVAFEASGPNGDTVASATAAGGDYTSHVTSPDGYAGNPSWSPDGSSLLYAASVRERGSPTRIYKLTNGSSQQLIPEARNPSNPNYLDFDPDWSPTP